MIESQSLPLPDQMTGSKIIPASHYFPALQQLILAAKKRVYLDTLYVSESSLTETLIRQARLGLSSKLKVAPVGMRNRRLRDRLLQNSVSIELAHPHTHWYERWQNSIPFLRIHHGKSFVIDDVAGLGGINLDPGYASMIDFMLQTDNPSIVGALEHYFLHSTRFQEDTEIICNPDTSLLVDIGKPFCSSIQRRSLSLIANAREEILVISQYHPEGKVHRLLQKKALEGLSVSVIVPRDTYDLTHKFNRVVAQASKSLHNKSIAYKLIRIPHYVHAKGLVIDRSRTITGSHNITAPTNNCFGLTELAIDTSDTTIVAAVYAFIQQAANMR